MTLILIVLLLLILFGGGFGIRSGRVTYGDPVSIIILIILIMLVIGLFLPFAGYRWYP